MSIEMIRHWLLVCGLINVVMLTFWGVFFIFAHDWMYSYHGKWFKLSVEKFDAIHYAGMMFFKLCIFVFNIIPYFALLIVAA